VGVLLASDEVQGRMDLARRVRKTEVKKDKTAQVIRERCKRFVVA